MPIKEKTVEEKIQDVAVLNDKVKELNDNLAIAQGLTDENGMVTIMVPFGGERRRMQVPATLLTGHFSAEAQVKTTELQTSQALING